MAETETTIIRDGNGDEWTVRQGDTAVAITHRPKDWQANLGTTADSFSMPRLVAQGVAEAILEKRASEVRRVAADTEQAFAMGDISRAEYERRKAISGFIKPKGDPAQQQAVSILDMYKAEGRKEAEGRIDKLAHLLSDLAGVVADAASPYRMAMIAHPEQISHAAQQVKAAIDKELLEG